LAAVWDVTTGQPHSSYVVPTGGLSALAFDPSGTHLVGVGYRNGPDSRGSGDVWVWAVAPGREPRPRAHRAFTLGETRGPRADPVQMARSVAWSPDGARLVVGTYAGRVIFLDAATGKEAARWEGHGDVVSSLAFHPTRNELVSAGWDGKVLARDLGTGQP